MRWPCGVVVATLLASCGSSDSAPTNSADSIVAEDAAVAAGATVPSVLLGSWRQVSEECEEGEQPASDFPETFIRFHPDFRYELTVAGWAIPGQYEIVPLQDKGIHIRLSGSMHNFRLDNGRLENWSEGDAVYLCGRIFAREKD